MNHWTVVRRPNRRAPLKNPAKPTTRDAQNEENTRPFQDLSPLTIQRYAWFLNDFKQWCRASGISPEKPKIREIADYLKDRQQWGTSRKTVALAALRRWFDYCGLEENPAMAPSLRKTGRAGKAFAPKRLPVALNDSESEAFLQAVTPKPGDSFPTRRKYQIQRLLFWTGLRVSEAVSLRVDDLHLDGEQPMLVVVGKGNKERQVPLSIRLAVELQEYLELRAEFLAANGRLDPMAFPLFCDRNGQPYTTGGMWSIVKSTLERIGVQKRHCGPHVLRHTFATRQLQSGVAPAIVKAWMGHSDLRVLFSVYEHVLSSPKGVFPVD